MGLKIEGLPDPMNRRFVQTRRPSPSNTGSSALRPSASSQGSGERPRRRRRRSGAARRDAARRRDPATRSVHPRTDVLVLRSFRRVQNDSRPLGQTLRGLAPRRQALKFAALALRQVDRNSRLAPSPKSSTLTLAENRVYLSIRRWLQTAASMTAAAKLAASLW
jgi:hypothetical protein